MAIRLDEVYSQELRAHLWQGERLRTAAALVLLAAVAGTAIARDVLVPSESMGRLAINLSALAGVAILELGWFMVLSRTRRQTGEPPRILLAFGAAIEANFPTVGIFLSLASPMVSSAEALSAPVVLLYLLFIMLSALRMRPKVCILSGVAACSGYLAMAIHAYSLASKGGEQSMGLGFTVSVASILLLAGVLAALVSHQILQNASRAVATAIEQRKLMEDMAVARTIQRSLLPTDSPNISGYELAGSSDPADETGGDHFDWLPLPDGRLAITQADVTGHGIGPALLTANLHAYVHAIISADGGLCEWLTRLNGYMAEDLGGERFVTFAAATLDPKASVVEILSAGHGPILFYSASRGEVLELGAQGPPLGVIEDFDYRGPHRLDLQAGDALMLITDGFFEWANAEGEQFGIERLKDSLLRCHASRAWDIIEAIHGDVRTFAAGAPQMDDLTAVVLKRTPPA